MTFLQVDLSEIGSVKLYASYLLRTTLTIAATVVCVSMVAYQVSHGKQLKPFTSNTLQTMVQLLHGRRY
jgi:hypothetical protein